MHDGKQPYPGVLEVIQKLKDVGKDLIIVSNSSKRRENSMQMLTKLGFDPTNFAQIITSGEVAYHLLKQSTTSKESELAPQPWPVLNNTVWSDPSRRNVFCFGSGDGDDDYLTSCGWKLSPMNEADLIVARGTFTIDDGRSVIHKTKDGEEKYWKAFDEQIRMAAERRLPMIVSNPDKIRPDADKSPMPGTIGDAYETALGGDDAQLVKRIGKPFEDVYEIALRNRERSRACMIGDALETDVTGGVSQGIDSIWVVNDGIHNDNIRRLGEGSLIKGCIRELNEFNQLKDTYAKGKPVSPVSIMPHFRW